MKQIINAVNWDVALKYACIGAALVCLIYMGIFILAPFFRMLLA